MWLDGGGPRFYPQIPCHLLVRSNLQGNYCDVKQRNIKECEEKLNCVPQAVSAGKLNLHLKRERFPAGSGIFI
jgi:hypothetical protein